MPHPDMIQVPHMESPDMDEKPPTPFDDLMRKLVKVPKAELERARKHDARRKAKMKKRQKQQK